ncbi:MAG: hypothetical protein D8M54_00950 [Chloroflexi bacterium]|nr:hypothetical protein [Chloroflexota bacterium]
MGAFQPHGRSKSGVDGLPVPVPDRQPFPRFWRNQPHLYLVAQRLGQVGRNLQANHITKGSVHLPHRSRIAPQSGKGLAARYHLVLRPHQMHKDGIIRIGLRQWPPTNGDGQRLPGPRCLLCRFYGEQLGQITHAPVKRPDGGYLRRL